MRGERNCSRLNATLATSFGNRSDNGNVTKLSGTMEVALAPKTQPFDSLHVENLDFVLVDPISLDFNYLIARLRANSAAGGLRFLMETPGPATTVDAGGNFTQTGNSLRITGTVDILATGLAAGLVPDGPMPIDTVANDITLSGKITQSGATLTISGPLAFSGVFPVDATTTLTMNVTGNYVATSQVAPPGADSNVATASISVQPQNDGPFTASERYLVSKNRTLVVPALLPGATETLVPAGASWRYLDDATNQGTAWRSFAFNDSAWPEGAAKLGYGEGDEATTLNNGGNVADVTPTYYFRHRFMVAEPRDSAALLLRLVRDDGAAVYLNGNEVVRENLAPGAGFGAFANATVGGADESRFFEFPLDPALLHEGANVLAVEIHQAASTSEDVSFDLELLRTRGSGGVLANDHDAENQSLSGTVVVPPVSGTLVLSPNGAFSYTPNAGFTGTDTFRYAVGDGEGTNAREILPLGAQWRYLADGSDQGTQWSASAFDDSAWPSGRGELGYGDGDEGTLVGFGLDASNKFATTYFRSAFFLRTAPTAGQVTLSLRRDDAAAIYINGSQVYRDTNLAVGALFSDFATAGVGDENAYITITPVAGLLLPGRNVIAAEVHQANPTSSDLSFDLAVRIQGVPLFPLVPQGSVWSYLDTGANLGGVAWKTSAFDDSAWSAGAAKLGYGDGDAQTVVSFGPDGNNKYATTYFRKRFRIADASRVDGLQLRLLRDDGAAVYLNGTELVRDGLAPGATFNQFASATASDLDEYAFRLFSVDPAALVDGENVLAVEVHQATAGSSDLGFDLELLAAASANVREATLTVVETDTDRDGMDDDYERAFGLVVGVDDSGDDLDGDGQTNLAESASGTDPFSADSVFRATSIEMPGGFRVEFSAVPGKRYFLQTTTNFGTWMTNPIPFVATGTSGFFDIPAPAEPTYWRVRTSAD